VCLFHWRIPGVEESSTITASVIDCFIRYLLFDGGGVLVNQDLSVSCCCAAGKERSLVGRSWPSLNVATICGSVVLS